MIQKALTALTCLHLPMQGIHRNTVSISVSPYFIGQAVNLVYPPVCNQAWRIMAWWNISPSDDFAWNIPMKSHEHRGVPSQPCSQVYTKSFRRLWCCECRWELHLTVSYGFNLSMGIKTHKLPSGYLTSLWNMAHLQMIFPLKWNNIKSASIYNGLPMVF